MSASSEKEELDQGLGNVCLWGFSPAFSLSQGMHLLRTCQKQTLSQVLASWTASKFLNWKLCFLILLLPLLNLILFKGLVC